MHRILPATRSWPLHDIAATRRAESANESPHVLMQRAGEAVARLALAIAPHASRIWIACGGGNNGGDGLEAAMHLQAAGKVVHVSLLGDATKLPADAAASLVRARAAGLDIHVSPPAGAVDLVIDALLGIGTRGALRHDAGQLIDIVNRTTALVLAIDVPSGLNADTGQPADRCVRADHTLSLLTLKPGLFTAHGRDAAGEVWFDDLGVDARSPQAVLAGADMALASDRRHAQHKGSFGDVAVIGGAPGMTGAALLAARAAHAAGAGRVYVSLLDDDFPLLDLQRPELMLRQRWWQQDDATLLRTRVVCGCGGGEAVRHVLPRLLGSVERLVLDADALNAVAADETLKRLLRARADRGRQTILTPHPLEAARLLAVDVPAVQADRLDAARRLAETFACVVVLKGSGTLVAAPGAKPHINASGNASLATAGTGDVLAGWIGGRWHDDAFEAAVASVWLHGRAADDQQPSGPLRAGDLVERMRALC